jgi:multidrug transporter EmrE-like cation transporter
MSQADVAAETDSSPAVTPRESRTSGWSFAHRVAFRFVFSYLAICIFPFPFGSDPGSVYSFYPYDRMWFAFVPWFAAHILRLSRPITIFPAGSGDTTFNYVQILIFALIAAFATIIWTALDRRRAEYRSLHEWFRIYVRYALAFTMLAYGMDKVIKNQFADPGLQRLAEPFGEYSPFSLLWTFMGFSTGYTHFAGACEVIGGVLLFFRRATTLGALILCGVLANVVALNYFYDVPVKLFSTHLLLMAVFLVLPDVKRLIDFFVRNRVVASANLESPFRWPWMKIPHIVVKTTVVLFAVCWFTGQNIYSHRLRANYLRSPLYGLYQVETFLQNGQPVPLSDSGWRRLILDYRSEMAVLSMDDSISYFGTKYDETKNSVTLTTEKGKVPDGVLQYSHPDADHLELRGNFKNQSVVIELRKVDASKFELVSRGFHWINEDVHAR